MEAGCFREDLYYPLNVVQIHVPPLRARGNDVLLLAQHFVRTFAERMGEDITAIASEAAKKLLEYDWPGNVHQLELHGTSRRTDSFRANHDGGLAGAYHFLQELSAIQLRRSSLTGSVLLTSWRSATSIAFSEAPRATRRGLPSC